MNHLQGKTRFDAIARPPRPTAQQIPSSKPEMFSHQQPDPGEVAADFVGQALSHSALKTDRVTKLVLGAFATDASWDLDRFMARAALIEFFFEGRIRR